MIVNGPPAGPKIEVTDTSTRPAAANRDAYQIIQGGQYTAQTDASSDVNGFTTIGTYQPIHNESNDAVHANTIGTLATLALKSLIEWRTSR